MPVSKNVHPLLINECNQLIHSIVRCQEHTLKHQLAKADERPVGVIIPLKTHHIYMLAHLAVPYLGLSFFSLYLFILNQLMAQSPA